MKYLKHCFCYPLYLILGFAFLFGTLHVQSQTVNFSGHWGNEGFNLTGSDAGRVIVTYSVHGITMHDMEVEGLPMKSIELFGHFLPAQEGAPNLPGTGRLIAVPQGAKPVLKVVSYRTEVFNNLDIAPSPRIPWDTEDSPLEYIQDKNIYESNSYYPENPVQLSELTQIRGVDAVMLGITPFQYNPVSGELIVYSDFEIEIAFEDGNGYFGDDRLRSRWWEPLHADMFLNYTSLPKMDYNKNFQGNAKETGCEYLIITPTGSEFLQWADSIKVFRTLQGISTDIVTVDEIGGNNANSIETYVNNAFNTWDIVPAAILVLADYGTNPANNVISPVWNNYCASDNIWADVSNNNLPDIIFARITASNATHLQVMVSKFLNYERNPPTNPDFYAHPITALGWQTERWFQICSETVGGYWKHVQGKDPVRINAIYSGSPGTVWSTAQNTATVVNYFGQGGLGYIPATPAELGGWTGGNATMVNNAINSGAFMLQHRDHGFEQGWGEPYYGNGNINSLTNTDLTFVLSINCLTGKYNIGSECFTEKFHRHTSGGNNAGALGVLAASEISYSFVNDAFVWGVYDNMWPDFMPTYGTTPESRDVMPAFGNAAGKYFLFQSSWPYNTNNKLVTYHLFHHHGDAFLTVYSEVPQHLTVEHESTLMEGVEEFEVTANTGALIALTVDGEIIGTGVGTGAPVAITIPAQNTGSEMIVTITKQNFYRYSASVDVIPSTSANAGADGEVCEGNDYLCEGEASNYTSLEWSTSGTGTFSDNTLLNTLYTPSEDDIANGSVSLTLTVHSTEVTVSDDMILNISHTPSAHAGEDTGVCETESFAFAEASAENYLAVEWATGGDGSFDDIHLVQPVYTPGSNDIVNGTVTLTMNVTALGSCANTSDQIVLTIYKVPEASAGEDVTICGSIPFLLEDAEASNFASLLWTTSGDGTFDDNTILHPAYSPGENDNAGGTVMLSLSAEGFANCGNAVAEVTLSVVEGPMVDAGPDGEICKDVSFSLSSASVSGANSFVWSSGGDGTFNDMTLMNPVYAPGEQDIAEGSVVLSLIATGNSPCDEITDELILQINDCFDVAENRTLVSFGIFPNPSDGIVNLALQLTESKMIHITVFNAFGETVRQWNNIRVSDKHEQVINLSEEPGIYYLRVTGNDLDISRKIIVR